MAKTRLTKADREAIRTAIIEHKFVPIRAAHEVVGQALAERARGRAYGDYITTMDAAPEGAFHDRTHLYVAVNGQRYSLKPSAPVRVFAAHEYSTMLLLTDADPLGAEIAAWAHAGEQMKGDQRKLTNVTDSTLAGFTTFEDLLTGWPEAAAFINARWQSRPDYVANVPAVVIKDLSAQLDLPPEDLPQAA